MSLERIFLVVLAANLVGFGGLSSLPILRGQIQSAGLPADNLLLHALAIGNISPGPNGLYLVVAGYFIGGIKGAGAATLALVIPPFLVIILENLRSRLLHLPRFRAVMHSLSLSVIALLIPSSAALAAHAATDLLGVAMVIMGAIVLSCRASPLVGIGIALVIGLVVR
ncbi:chromate transporter [Sodalis ligni]|uniref:chromate transporter n=1 Tax=Sodalis ligni TaxID=2697027 RepID=UPI00193F5EFB|nr:chromate transporter [Sodalis ligni]QWA13040.1 chromate transporter [Sodalis ligni]